VSVSENFTREAMQVDLVGLKVEDMVAYTKCVADTLLEYMGYSKIYNVSNPLEWMVLISLINKSNFFEKKVSEYARAEDGNIEWEQVFN
jgi:ribonucleotide reductase beta subunit family protein with ferritin-like domain